MSKGKYKNLDKKRSWYTHITKMRYNKNENENEKIRCFISKENLKLCIF